MNRREFFGLCAVAAVALRLPKVREVDWLIPGKSLYDFSIRDCECCYESFHNDVWADKPIRKFYETVDECPVTVCEHCLPEAARRGWI